MVAEKTAMLRKKRVVTSLEGVRLQGRVVQKPVNADPDLELTEALFFLV